MRARSCARRRRNEDGGGVHVGQESVVFERQLSFNLTRTIEKFRNLKLGGLYVRYRSILELSSAAVSVCPTLRSLSSLSTHVQGFEPIDPLNEMKNRVPREGRLRSADTKAFFSGSVLIGRAGICDEKTIRTQGMPSKR